MNCIYLLKGKPTLKRTSFIEMSPLKSNNILDNYTHAVVKVRNSNFRKCCQVLCILRHDISSNS